MYRTAASRRTTAQTPLSNNFRSGLEERVANELKAAGVPFEYEKKVIDFIWPAKKARYTPDLVIPAENSQSGLPLIVELKGRFLVRDRQKHLLVKQQHPEIEIRFVFSRSKERIGKKSTTTYGMWCEKNGFKYADVSIPKEWLKD